MDYLDPKKRFRHTVILMVGYVLVGIAIVIGTLVLLYQAYGFGLNKNGKVIQNGLFFFSSQPHPAQIYVDGALKNVRTNTRLSLPAGVYEVVLRRDGYRDWQRTIALEGGSVEHFDYPFLIPKVLAPGKVATYSAEPGLMTQSSDRRWLLVQKPGNVRDFDIYDLKRPDKASTTLSLPASLLSKASGPESLQEGEWAGDNRHVLIRHVYDNKAEFVMVDRADPSKSVNLSKTLQARPHRLTLVDRKYDQYYLYDDPSKKLNKASLKDTASKPYLERVLAYKSYGRDTMLYVTDEGAPAGKVWLKLRAGDQVDTLRSFPTGSPYLLDLTEYSGDMYVVAGAVKEGKLYIYRDPVGQLADEPGRTPVPTQVLRLKQPDYLSFSDNAQFIVAEHGTEFAVYDIENEQVFHYKSLQKLDKPQPHATWMDGNRLTFVSGGKMVVFDYDNANRQVLISASPRYEPAFTPDYKSVYTLTTAASGRLDLDRTWLLTPADQ